MIIRENCCPILSADYVLFLFRDYLTSLFISILTSQFSALHYWVSQRDEMYATTARCVQLLPLLEAVIDLGDTP